MRARLVLIVLAPILLSLPAAVEAQQSHTVAIAPFSGRRTAPVRRRVASALADRADVVSTSAADDAAANTGIDGLASGGVSMFADAVNAQIVILGEVETTRARRRRRRRRRRATQRTVRLVAYSASGDQLAQAEFDAPAGRRGNGAIDENVALLWDQAVAAWEAAQAPPPEPEPAVDMSFEEPPPEPEDEPSEAPDDGLQLIAGWVGLVVRNRDAFVQLTPMGERRYGATYAELGFAVEGRPFAREGHLGRGTWASFEFFHSVGLGSVVDDPSMTAVDGTNFARFELMAGWMYAFADNMVEAGIGFGGGYDSYHFGANPILPTVELGYLRPAARGRIRLLDETVVLDVQLAYRGIVTVGAVADAFGADAEAHGVDLGIGFTGNLEKLAELGFTWGVRFQYVGYFLGYSGMASDAQGESGTEESIRFTIMAGWGF